MRKKIGEFGVEDVAHILKDTMISPDGREGFDASLAITGQTGRGKSELALSVSLELSRLLRYKPQLDKWYVWSRKELEDAIVERPRRNILIADEAIKVLYGKDDRKNTDLVKKLNICRDRNHALIFCIPQMYDIESSIRNDRIRLCLWVQKRGVAWLFRPDNKPRFSGRQSDPWNSKYFTQMERAGRTDFYNHPCCMAKVTFKPVPDDYREEYRKLKEAYALKDDSDSGPDESAIGLLKYLEDKGVKFYGLKKAVAEFLDVSHQTVNNRIERLGD